VATLQNGLLKIPNLNFTAWNADNKSLEHDIIYKLSATKNKIVYPSLDPCVFEVKYPDIDIKGNVV
jgi:hypothetical protein